MLAKYNPFKGIVLSFSVSEITEATKFLEAMADGFRDDESMQLAVRTIDGIVEIIKSQENTAVS